VSVKRGQIDCDDMTKCQSMGVIGAEAFMDWIVVGGVDDWLVVWFASSQAVEADVVVGEIDFGSHEAVGPKRVDEIAASLNLDLGAIVRSPEVDDSSLKRKLVIGFPANWERSSAGSGIGARSCAAAHGTGKAIGAVLNGLMVKMKETLPDPDLPAAVEVLDEGLEAGLMGRRKDGDDAELQAEPDDTTKGITELTGTAENRVVVELGVVWQSVLPPVLDERLRGENSSPGRSHPGTTKSPVQTDRGQNVDGGAALQAKIFDEIKAVQFGKPGGDAREIPAFGRWWATNSLASIEGAATQENSTDRAQRGNLFEPPLSQSAPNGYGAKFAQIAFLQEVLTNSQNQILHADGSGRSSAPPSTRKPRPVDTIQSLACSTVHPTLYGRQSDPKLHRHRTQRESAPHCANDTLPPSLKPVFCSRRLLEKRVFSCTTVTSFD